MIENGTMTVLKCGCSYWLNNMALYHRLDGPAFEAHPSCKLLGHTEDNGCYFIYGEALSQESWKIRVEGIKQKALKEIGERILKCYAWRIVHVRHGATAEYVDSLYVEWLDAGGQWDEHHDCYRRIYSLFEQTRKGN